MRGVIFIPMFFSQPITYCDSLIRWLLFFTQTPFARFKNGLGNLNDGFGFPLGPPFMTLHELPRNDSSPFGLHPGQGSRAG